ncbi:MAG: hypothetical protein VYE77_10580 [Planctomycetota bacterium]|nr:hypothetical protein [Planctomycetota bacterium]
MPTRTFSVLLAASLATAIAAQSPGHPSTSPASGLAPNPITESDGSSGSLPTSSPWRLEEEGLESMRARMAMGPQQGPDYSLRGMFWQEHGDFMQRHERYDPMLEISSLVMPDAKIKSEDGRFDLYEFQGDFLAPVMISTEAYLELGAFIGTRHYTSQNMIGFEDTNLNNAGVHLGFGVFVDDNVLLEGMVSPGSWSDWESTLHHEDYDFPGGVLLTVQPMEEGQLFWKIGARYNEVFADANFLPWLGLAWHYQEYRFDVLLPEYVEFSYWPIAEGGAQPFGVLAGAQIQGAEYRVHSSLATGKQAANVHVQEILVYGGLIGRFNDSFSLQGRTGLAVAGDYKLADGNPATSGVNGTLRPTFFFEVTMGFDF